MTGIHRDPIRSLPSLSTSGEPLEVLADHAAAVLADQLGSGRIR